LKQWGWLARGRRRGFGNSRKGLSMANKLVGSFLIISSAVVSGYQHLAGHVVMDSIFFAPLAIVGAVLIAASIYEGV